MKSGSFPGGPVVKNLLAVQGMRVWFLVRELRSYMPQSNGRHKHWAQAQTLESLSTIMKDPVRHNYCKTQCNQINIYIYI